MMSCHCTSVNDIRHGLGLSVVALVMSWSQDHILRVLVWAWTQPWFYLVFPQSQISRQFILSYFKTSQDHYFKATVYRLEPNRYTSGLQVPHFIVCLSVWDWHCTWSWLTLNPSKSWSLLGLDRLWSCSWLGLSSSGLDYNINSCYTDGKCTEG